MYRTSSLRSNRPDRQAKPMSTVRPSPPWPSTGMSVRRVQRVAGAEGLAAALAGTVPAGQRVGPAGTGLLAALVLGEQPVPDREAAGLVELDPLVRHGLMRSVMR